MEVLELNPDAMLVALGNVNPNQSSADQAVVARLMAEAEVTPIEQLVAETGTTLGTQDGTSQGVGYYSRTETVVLGLDSSGQPDYSGAPAGYDVNGDGKVGEDDTLRFHQGGTVKVTTVCDPATGESSNSVELTTTARAGSVNETVTWGLKSGKELFRMELAGGKTVVIPNLPSGTFDIGWIEEADTEGKDVSGLPIVDAVDVLNEATENGEVTRNVSDDMRSYHGAFTIDVCEKEVPATTSTTTSTTSTTSIPPTTVPEETTSTTAPTTVPAPKETTTVEETTTTVPAQEVFVPEETTTTLVQEVRLVPATNITRELAATGIGVESMVGVSVAMIAAGGLALLTKRVNEIKQLTLARVKA